LLHILNFKRIKDRHNNNPIVSVVIPTYKRVNSLRKAIDSVTKQSINNIEIIIVNDYSPDLNQLKNLVSVYGDARIKIYNNKRETGANGARNTGLIKARGKYVAFLDDDDTWYQYKLYKQITTLKADHGIIAAICGYKYIVSKNVFNIVNDTILNGHSDYFNHHGGLAIGSTLLVDRSILIDLGGWDERLQRFQDLDLMIRLTEIGIIKIIPYIGAKVNVSRSTDGFAMEVASDIIFNKLNIQYINILPEIIKKFISTRYRDAAVGYSKEKNINGVFSCIKKSIKIYRLPYNKYILVIIVFFNSNISEMIQAFLIKKEIRI